MLGVVNRLNLQLNPILSVLLGVVDQLNAEAFASLELGMHESHRGRVAFGPLQQGAGPLADDIF